jgi:hypothetical protein
LERASKLTGEIGNLIGAMDEIFNQNDEEW